MRLNNYVSSSYHLRPNAPLQVCSIHDSFGLKAKRMHATGACMGAGTSQGTVVVAGASLEGGPLGRAQLPPPG